MAQGCRPLAGICAVVFLVTAWLAQPAPAAEQAPKAPCDGVRLLTSPYLVAGVGDLIIEVSAPVDDRVLCQPVNLRSAVAKRGCENSRVPGHRLKPRLAAAATRCLIDKVRAGHGLNQLDPQANLKQAAKRHTENMLARSCFSHICPGEADLVGRVTSTGYLPCTCTWSVGENLAWGLGKRGSPAAIVDAWMASPPHRAMILNASMRDVDIGVRSGKPGGRNSGAATYTADFGVKS